MQRRRNTSPQRGGTGPVAAGQQWHRRATGGGYQGRFGLFTDVDEAVAAAREAFERLSAARSTTAAASSPTSAASPSSSASSWARWRWKRPRSAAWRTRSKSSRRLANVRPGVEFLRSEVFSGDHGLAVIEHAPFGVICGITPVTHSLPTITGNA